MPGRVTHPAACGESSPSETSSGRGMSESMQVSKAAAEASFDVLGRLILDEKRAVEVQAGEQFAVIEIAVARSGRAPAGSGAQPVFQVAVLDATAQKVELAVSVAR